MQAIVDTISNFGNWLLSLLLYVPKIIFSWLTDILAFSVSSIMGLIPSQLSLSALSQIPSGVWYFLDIFQLTFGLEVLIASLVARFLLRRLPFVG